MSRLVLVAWLMLASIAEASESCFDKAAERYKVPAGLLYAIAQTESGVRVGARNINKNGTEDIGVMQINSSWLKKLKQYGIERESLYDACTNIHVGAWVLAHNIKQYGQTWEAVGAYNAGCISKDRAACEEIRSRYVSRVWKKYQQSLARKQ
jgi:soluble lytic murein transglycosylase-like protein